MNDNKNVNIFTERPLAVTGICYISVLAAALLMGKDSFFPLCLIFLACGIFCICIKNFRKFSFIFITGLIAVSMLWGCLVCGGKGCSVCKQVGWIEIMPGGTPHPNVLRAGGLDPDEYTGFYVNIGLDRLVMMRYGVDDVRLFHSADLRFLEQFN